MVFKIIIKKYKRYEFVKNEKMSIY